MGDQDRKGKKIVWYLARFCFVIVISKSFRFYSWWCSYNLRWSDLSVFIWKKHQAGSCGFAADSNHDSLYDIIPAESADSPQMASSSYAWSATENPEWSMYYTKGDVTDFTCWSICHCPHRPLIQHPLTINYTHSPSLTFIITYISSSLEQPINIFSSLNLISLPLATMSGENELRCNNLKCRRYVAADGKAVVTTCSRTSHSQLLLSQHSRAELTSRCFLQ